MRGILASSILLRHFRTGDLPPEPYRLEVWIKYGLIRVRRGRHQACIYRACQEATYQGIRSARQLRQSNKRFSLGSLISHELRKMERRRL